MIVLVVCWRLALLISLCDTAMQVISEQLAMLPHLAGQLVLWLANSVGLHVLESLHSVRTMRTERDLRLGVARIHTGWGFFGIGVTP